MRKLFFSHGNIDNFQITRAAGGLHANFRADVFADQSPSDRRRYGNFILADVGFIRTEQLEFYFLAAVDIFQADVTAEYDFACI